MAHKINASTSPKSFKTYFFLALCQLVLLFLIMGVVRDGGAISPRKTVILTDTSILAGLIQPIIKKNAHIEVKSLLGPYEDPHTHQTTLSDIKKIVSADYVIYSGLDLAPNLEKKLLELKNTERSDQPTQRILCATQPLHAGSTPALIVDEDYGQPDMHWWTSIRHVELVVTHLGEVLRAAGCLDEERFQSFLKELQGLFLHVKSELDRLDPAEKPVVIITTHDAFRYLSYDLPFEVYSILGVSPEVPLSEEKQQKLLREMAKQPNKAWEIFVEDSISDQVVLKLVERARSQQLQAKKSAVSLPSDGLGACAGYLEMMDFLFEQFVPSYTPYLPLEGEALPLEKSEGLE